MYSVKAFFVWSIVAVLASALDENTHPHQEPGSTDVRSPCPGLNALANHGLLPRDGKNIDLIALADGLYTGYHLDHAASMYVGGIGIRASSTGNASTFNLDDLAQHSPQVLEHDGSMSRNDSYWGDNLSFNDQAWNRTLANWGDHEIITVSYTLHGLHLPRCQPGHLSKVSLYMDSLADTMPTTVRCCCSGEDCACSVRDGNEP